MKGRRGGRGRRHEDNVLQVPGGARAPGGGKKAPGILLLTEQETSPGAVVLFLLPILLD